MCVFGISAATAAYIAAGTAVVGAGVTAASAMSSAQAQAKEASYQSKVAANNAEIAQQNRAYAVASGEAQAQRQSLTARAQLSALRGAEAANDVDINSGSASDVQKSQRELGALDTATTMNNALLTAYGYSTQATNASAQSQLDKSEVGSDLTGGELKAAGGLLSSAGSTALAAGGGGGGGATASGGGQTTIGAYGAS